MTALMRAANNGKTSTCEWLINHGADINAAGKVSIQYHEYIMCDCNVPVCLLYDERSMSYE